MTDESPTKHPSEKDKPRLEQYDYGDNLYLGNHFEAFHIKAQEDMSENYSRLRYLSANFPALITNTLANMLFGENITIDVENEKTQKYLTEVMEANQFKNQLYESALVNSRRGDAIFKVRVGKRNPLSEREEEIIIEEIPAFKYFPQFENDSARNQPSSEVIATQIEDGDDIYLHKEIHTPGYIYHELWLYDKDSGELKMEVDPGLFDIPEEEETGLDHNTVFHIPNVRIGKGFFGTSDYQGLDSLFFAINNRMTKIDNVLDKHSDPVLAVPSGVIDDDGNFVKEAMGVFQVDADNPGFNKPEYIVWDAQMEASFKQIDAMMNWLHMLSEVPAAASGNDKDGMAESGRALKFKLLAAIGKRNRKIRYYDQGIRDILTTVQELGAIKGIEAAGETMGEIERPNVKWGDGVINDEVEMVDIAEKRLAAGLSSKADEIARLDDISMDEAKKKAEEIEEENAPDVSALEFQTDPNEEETNDKQKPPIKK